MLVFLLLLSSLFCLILLLFSHPLITSLSRDLLDRLPCDRRPRVPRRRCVLSPSVRISRALLGLICVSLSSELWPIVFDNYQSANDQWNVTLSVNPPLLFPSSFFAIVHRRLGTDEKFFEFVSRLIRFLLKSIGQQTPLVSLTSVHPDLPCGPSHDLGQRCSSFSPYYPFTHTHTHTHTHSRNNTWTRSCTS